MLEGKKIGIIVGPGGCTGAITAGMFAELVTFFRRSGRTPSYIQGISVGGLTACGYTQPGEMLKTWLRLGKRGIFSLFNYGEALFRFFGLATSWFTNHGLVRLVQRIDPERLFVIRDKTEIEIAVLDEEAELSREAQRTLFLSNRGRVIKKRLVYPTAKRWKEFLEAGCCIQGILPPKIIAGKTYSDALHPSFGRSFMKGCDIVFFCASDQPSSDRPPSKLMRWLKTRWFTRIRKPFDVEYDGNVEHKLRVLLSSKKHPGIKLFALNAPVALVNRLQDVLTPLTPENFARAERAVVIVTPDRTIDRLNTIYFTEKSIREAIRHGRDRMREALRALGLIESHPPPRS